MNSDTPPQKVIVPNTLGLHALVWGGHMNIEEQDFTTPVAQCGPRLGYVHVGESHRGYVCSGHVDLAALFRVLVETGYTGAITFEGFSSPTPAGARAAAGTRPRHETAAVR